MKKETFIGSIVLIGVWMLTNWFRIIVVLFLVLISIKMDYLVDNTMKHNTVVDPQYADFRDLNASLSDIKDNTENTTMLLQDMDYHTQYPSILR